MSAPPDLESLRLLVYVAELGSVGRAARAMGIAQPSATKRLAALERRAGLPLLVRTPAGSTPTTDGKLVVAWATAPLAAAEEFQTSLTALRTNNERLSPSLGDLSDVRVHTNDTADALNTAVSARAFATGTDVYFAQGEYKPNTMDGDRLIAHELAHVVQQRGAPTSGPLTVSQPGDALEREADDVAGKIA